MILLFSFTAAAMLIITAIAG